MASLSDINKRADAVDVEVDDGLLAFGAEEEGAVGAGVHEEVFGIF